MSYWKFTDSKGRTFEANLFCSHRAGVDSVYELEDAHYLDGEQDSVSQDELDIIYNEIGWENRYL